MMKRRIIISFLIIFMLMMNSCLYISNASTDGDFKLNLIIEKETIKSGDEFEVSVKVEKNDINVYGIQGKLSFDDSVLELIGDDELANVSTKENYEITCSKQGDFVVVETAFNEIELENVFTVKFKAKKDINIKETKIILKDVDIANENWDVIKVPEVTKVLKIDSNSSILNISGNNSNRVIYITLVCVTILFVIIFIFVAKSKKKVK